MIGFIAGEDATLIELWPVFGSEEGIPKKAQLRVKKALPEKCWGEYSVAFSRGETWRDFTVWVTWGISTYPRDFDSYARKVRRWFKKCLA